MLRNVHHRATRAATRGRNLFTAALLLCLASSAQSSRWHFDSSRPTDAPIQPGECCGPDAFRPAVRARTGRCFNPVEGIGVAFPIDSSFGYAAAHEVQTYPNLAWGDSVCLVVWGDRRTGSGDCDVVAARVTSDGVLLDSANIMVTRESGCQNLPAVAWDGSNWFVVYLGGWQNDHHVLGRRITRAGLVLDTQPIVISPPRAEPSVACVEFDGTTYFVVWRSRDQYIVGARVRPDGTVLDSAGIRVSGPTGDDWGRVDVASNGRDWLVTWQVSAAQYDIRAARVSSAGVLLDTTEIAVCAHPDTQFLPRVASDGTNWLVVWNDRRGLWQAIYCTRVSAAGVVLDSAIALTDGTRHVELPQVACTGNDWMVAWGSNDISGRRVSFGGTLLGPVVRLSDTAAGPSCRWPALAFGPGLGMVVWEDYRCYGDLRGTRISLTGEVLDPNGIMVARSAPTQLAPTIATNGRNWLVVWQEEVERSWDERTWGMLLDSSGHVTGPCRILVSTMGRNAVYPAVAACGSTYLVTNTEHEWNRVRITGRRVSSDGTVLDPAGITIASGYRANWWRSNTAVASDGNSWLVAWLFDDDTVSGVAAARVSPSGLVLDSFLLVSVRSSIGRVEPPAIAFCDSCWLVAWRCGTETPPHFVMGRRISSAGIVLDTAPFVVRTGSLVWNSPVRVSTDGTSFLVVTHEVHRGYVDIHGVPVTPSGTVPDTQGFWLTDTPGYKSNAVVSFDGTNYLLAWEDDYYWNDIDVVGAAVRPNGQLLAYLPLAQRQKHQTAPALSTRVPGQTQLVFRSWVDSIGPRPAHAVRLWSCLIESLDFSRNGDIGIAGIVSPSGRVPCGTRVTPSTRVRNLGSTPVSFVATCKLVDPDLRLAYYSTLSLVNFLPGEETTLVFAEYTFGNQPGTWAVFCSTWASCDTFSANDTMRRRFLVGSGQRIPGWTELLMMPPVRSGKAVKSGAWLVSGTGNGMIYAAKGNKTTDFYVWDPAGGTWGLLTPVPMGRENRAPAEGSAACASTEGKIYVTKGGNSLGFYCYDILRDSWTQPADVPLGAANKKVKGGTALAWLDGFVYLLKGGRNEFWKYAVAADSWISLPDAPLGISGKSKYDKGSWLVRDSAGRLFVHKAHYHELFFYDPGTNSWSTQLTGMPFIGSSGKHKKSKDGGCACWHGGHIYALKGGNTSEFWRYVPADDSWTALEDLPLLGSSGKKKKAKAGSSIVAEVDALFALKGNKTLEFWQYVPAAVAGSRLATGSSGISASPLAISQPPLAVYPNPLKAGFATLRLSEQAARGPVTVSVIDVSGRLVHYSSLITHRSAIPLDLRGLSAGVYTVHMTAGRYSATQRLVLQR